MGIRSIPTGSLVLHVPPQATILFYRPRVPGDTIILDNTVRVHIARGDAHTRMTSDTYTASYERAVRRPTALPRDRKLVVRWARTGIRSEIKERKGEKKRRARGRGKNGRRKKKNLSDRSQYAYVKKRGVAAG